MLTLSTNAFPNATYTWDVPTGWTYTQSGNTITATRTLNSVGTFSVQVSATSPYGTYQATAQQTLDWNRDLSLAVAGQTVAPFVLCGSGTEVSIVTDRSDLESYQWTASGLTLSTNNKVFTVASPAPGSNGENNGWIQVDAVSSCGYASTARLENLLRGLPPLPDPLFTVDKGVLISNYDGVNTDRAYAEGVHLPYKATYEWSSTPSNQIDVVSYGLYEPLAVVNPYIDLNDLTATVYGRPLIRLSLGTPCGYFEDSYQMNVHCAGCRVRPNPPIGKPGNGTLEVALGDSANQSLPFEGSYAELYDARDALVGKGDFDGSGKAQIALKNIQSAAYTLKAYTTDGRQFEQEWIVAPDSNSKLVLSPNPAVVNIDKELEGVIFGLSDSLAPYKVKLLGGAGQVLFQLNNANSHFTIPTTSLEPGAYLVTVQSQDGSSWQDSLEVVLNGAPHLTVSPNPTSSGSWCTLENYLQGMKDLTLVLVDNMGNTRWQGTGDAEGFTLHMETLPAGLYQLVANDGMHSYTLLVRKE